MDLSGSGQLQHDNWENSLSFPNQPKTEKTHYNKPTKYLAD